jgi:hypothetical protein
MIAEDDFSWIAFVRLRTATDPEPGAEVLENEAVVAVATG